MEVSYYDRINIIGYLYKCIAYEHNDFPENFLGYALCFCMLAFIAIFILSLIRNDRDTYKKMMILFSFAAGATLYLTHIFPYLTLYEKCFYCGRMHSFFYWSYKSYVAVAAIIAGIYLSERIKRDNAGIFDIKKRFNYLIVNYFGAFLFGLIAYLPLTAVLLFTNLPLSALEFLDNILLFAYLHIFAYCFILGLYTGWIIDKLVSGDRFSVTCKSITFVIMCFISSLYVLLYGLVYHVNEGSK